MLTLRTGLPGSVRTCIRPYRRRPAVNPVEGVPEPGRVAERVEEAPVDVTAIDLVPCRASVVDEAIEQFVFATHAPVSEAFSKSDCTAERMFAACVTPIV